MKKGRKITHFLVLFILLNSFSSLDLYSCSCDDPKSFCEILNDLPDNIVFKGQVIGITEHPGDYRTISIKKLQEFSEGTAITDTIELVGGPNDGMCQLSLSYMEIDDVKYFAMYGSSTLGIDLNTIPTQNELFSRYVPNMCASSFLNIIDDQVSFYDYINFEIITVPINQFEESLEDCDFTTSIEDVNYQSETEIYPNLILGNSLIINEKTKLNDIKSLRIFSTNGKLIFSEFDTVKSRTIDISNVRREVILVEIIYKDQRIVQKIYKH